MHESMKEDRSNFKSSFLDTKYARYEHMQFFPSHKQLLLVDKTRSQHFFLLRKWG